MCSQKITDKALLFLTVGGLSVLTANI